MIPSSGRVPEQGTDWFLVATEACSGGIPDLGFFLGVSVFIGIFGVGFTPGGSLSQPRGREARPGLFCPNSFTPWPSSGPKISSVKFQVNWTPFGIKNLRKLVGQEQGKIKNWHWALG